jgi:hypothetical protein
VPLWMQIVCDGAGWKCFVDAWLHADVGLGVPDVESVSWQMIFQLCSASRIRLNSHGRIGTLPSSEVLAQRLLPAAR